MAQHALRLAVAGADLLQLGDLLFELGNPHGENPELLLKVHIFCIETGVFFAILLEKFAALRGVDGVFVYWGRSTSGVICGFFELWRWGSACLRRCVGGELFERGRRMEVFDELLQVFKTGVHISAVRGELLSHLLPVGGRLAE